METVEIDPILLHEGFAQAGQVPEGRQTLNASIDDVELLGEACIDLGNLLGALVENLLIESLTINDIQHHEKRHGSGGIGDLLGGDGGNGA